ncbi:putative pseudouridylate synthase 3 [Rosellinia necatrix]|uniref:Putative pseudouridylate synthase 3 n=1 Tax=Rosellinia necatrix TaxID=77044 RepID=A0A1W2TK35_ROSNE|nr:putative pseudouridylate synthase 3 [Rosellinia necatrix]
MWALISSGSSTSSSSIGSACRSWLAPKSGLNQLQLAFAGRRAAQSNFSTTFTARARVGKQARMQGGRDKYGLLTKDALIERILTLESEIRAKDRLVSSMGGDPEIQPKPPKSPKKTKKKKKAVAQIDPSRYSTRLIALKIAYRGKNYGGFEYQPSSNIPTIEEELWKALVGSCLIFPENPDEVNWTPLEYSKCGRTDRGVSAFGQVVGIRVRSNRPLPKTPGAKPAARSDGTTMAEGTPEGTPEQTSQDINVEESPGETEEVPEREFNDVLDELPYARLLNRQLPPDIRILAWCPTPPAEFSARRHCRERQYRYYFTQPAYSPRPHGPEDPKARSSSNSSGGDKPRPRDGWLDIEAMRAAAKKYEGLHDFRNFCKMDGSKQLTNFQRRIFESDIVEVPDAQTGLPYLRDADFQCPSLAAAAATVPSEPSTTASPPSPPPRESFPKVYYFHVRGSAFLWHQIRCMVAVLFLVGQGLEAPSAIEALLDVEAEPRRPAYILANEAPLVLWDCIFPDLGPELDASTSTATTTTKGTGAGAKDAMRWVYVGEGNALDAYGTSGLFNHAWGVWRDCKMDEILAAQLLGVIAAQTGTALRRTDEGGDGDDDDPRRRHLPPPSAQRMFEGASRERGVGRYVPLLKKDRLATFGEVNDKHAQKKGYANAAHMREAFELKRAEAAAAVGAGAGVVDVDDVDGIRDIEEGCGEAAVYIE